MTLVPGTLTSRLAALLLLATGLLAMLIVIVLPFVAYTDHQHKMAAAYRQQTLVVEDQLNREAALRAAQEKDGTAGFEARLLPGSTPSAAAAAIQSRVQRLTAEAGGQVDSFSAAPPEELAGGQLIAITVQFRLTLTHRQLKDLLVALGQEERILSVQSLEISMPRGGRQEAGPQDPALRVSATISGYLPSEEVSDV